LVDGEINLRLANSKKGAIYIQDENGVLRMKESEKMEKEKKSQPELTEGEREEKGWIKIDPVKDADFFSKAWYLKFADERSNYILKYLVLKLTLPFAFAGLVIAILYIYTVTFYGLKTFEILGSAMLIYFLPPLGVEVAVPGAIYFGVPAYLIVLAITFIDANVGIFLVWNFDIAKRIPGVGAFIRKFEKKGRNLLQEKKWIENLSVIGIALFVMIPFQGSGAVGGALIGRAIGMNPYKVLLGVIIGSFMGALLVALFTDQFMEWFNIKPGEGF